LNQARLRFIHPSNPSPEPNSQTVAGLYEAKTWRADRQLSAISGHSLYIELGSDREKRQSAYRRTFTNMLDAKTLSWVRNTTNACLVPGNDPFKEQIEGMTGRSVQYVTTGTCLYMKTNKLMTGTIS